jgi:uncharacterized coiled-coil protein SlyX
MYVLRLGIFVVLTLAACRSEKVIADVMERLDFLEENDRKHEAKILDLEIAVEKKTHTISELESIVKKQNAEINLLKEHYLKLSDSVDDDVTYPEKSNEIIHSMGKNKRVSAHPSGKSKSINSPS